jgi:hypothetical protein
MTTPPYSESSLAIELSNLQGGNIQKWLIELLRENDQITRTMPHDIPLRQAQGKGQMIATLLDAIENAYQKEWDKQQIEKSRENINKLRRGAF